MYYYTRFPQDEKTLMSPMWYIRTLLSWLIRAIPLVYFPPANQRVTAAAAPYVCGGGRRKKEVPRFLFLLFLPPAYLVSARPPFHILERPLPPERYAATFAGFLKSCVKPHTLTFYFRKEGGRGTEWGVGRTGGGEVGLSEQIFEED